MYSLFTGWSNGVCAGTGDCLLTLAANSSVTANFAYDAAHQVQIDGTATYYSALQTAYAAASEGEIIKLWATAYNESLDCSRPVTVTLQGGYDSSYAGIIGDPVLNGVLMITDGTVVFEGFSIQ